jgi:hypothetical protein
MMGCSSLAPEEEGSRRVFSGRAPAEIFEVAADVVDRQFPLEIRDEGGMTFESRPVIENVVPGTELDRFRRKVHGRIVGEGVHLRVLLERAISASPIFYTGPWEVDWDPIGRDVEVERSLLDGIESALGGGLRVEDP